jgi:N-acetylneuraminic acid mutarotase
MQRIYPIATNASKLTNVTSIFLGISLLALAATVMAMGRAPSSWSLEWSQSASFPEPRAGYAAGVLDGKLVIAGGTYWEGAPGNWTKKRFSASTHAFDPDSQRWEKLPDLPVPLGYPASAVVGNRLFVLGGYTGSAVNHQIFTLQNIRGRYAWSVFGNLNVDRVFASAVSVGKSIYLVGGTTAFEALDAAGTCCTTQTATSSFMLFNVSHPAAGWQQLPPYPGGARWSPAVVINGGSICLFGGSFQADPTARTRTFDEVLKYDIPLAKWNVMPPLPKAIADQQPLTALGIDGNILLFTGQKTVWQLDWHKQRYAETTPMPEGAAVGQFFRLRHMIIGAGGESQIEGPRRRSPWTFIARVVPASPLLQDRSQPSRP